MPGAFEQTAFYEGAFAAAVSVERGRDRRSVKEIADVLSARAYRPNDATTFVDLRPRAAVATCEKTMPGGHTAATFELVVSDTEEDKASLIQKGWKLVVDDGPDRVWNGEVASITKKEPNRLEIAGHGVYGKGRLNEGYARTWWDARAAGRFVPHPNVSTYPIHEAFEHRADAGYLFFRFPPGADIANDSGCRYVYCLDDLLDEDGYIEKVTFSYDVDVSGSGWQVCVGWMADPMTIPWPSPGWAQIWTDQTASGTGLTLTAPPGRWPCLCVELYTHSAVSGNTDVRYVKLYDITVKGRGYGSVQPTPKAILVDVFVADGLAASSDTEEVGPPIGHAVAGLGNRTDAALELARLAGQPFEHGVWEDDELRIRNCTHKPRDLSRLVVVGPGQPGLESWDVTESDEDMPDAAFVLHGAKGRSDRPDGALTKTWWPARLDSPAGRVVKLDYSQYNLTDAEAAAVAAFEYAHKPPSFPTAGLRFLWHGARHDGEWPVHITGGGMVPFTPSSGQFRDLSPYAASGTPDGANMLDGWNIPSSPSRVTFNNSKILWGDLAQLNFGSEPRTLVCWVYLETLPASTQYSLLAKMPNASPYNGYELSVDTSGRVTFLISNNVGAGAYRALNTTATLETERWYCIGADYDGSTVHIFIDGESQSGTYSGTAGAYNTDNSEDFRMSSRSTGVFALDGSEAMAGAWARVLSADEHAAIAAQGPCWYERSLAKGQLVLAGLEVETGNGTRIDPFMVEPGWWVRHTSKLDGEPLYITRVLYNLLNRKVTLWVGQDRVEPWMGCYEPPPETFVDLGFNEEPLEPPAPPFDWGAWLR